jgi:hypothetical protein
VRIGTQVLTNPKADNPLHPIPVPVKSTSGDGLTATICSETSSDRTEYVLGVIQSPNASKPPTITGVREVYWIKPEIPNWYEFFGPRKESFMIRHYHRFVAKLDPGAEVGVQWLNQRNVVSVRSIGKGDSIAKLWLHQFLVQANGLSSKRALALAQKRQIPHWASWWEATKRVAARRKGGNR